MKSVFQIKSFAVIALFISLVGNVYLASAQETKQNLSLTLSYFKIVDGDSFIKIITSFKDDKGWHEAKNIPFKIFKIDDKETLIGNGITDEVGKMLFKIPKENLALENTFMLRVTNNPNFEDTEESLTFKEINLIAKLIENKEGKTITASLLDMQGNPIQEEGLQVQVKRMFNGLNIGDGTYFTDENGQISVNVDENYNSYDGNLIFEVTLEEHDEYGTVKAQMNSDSGIILPDLSTFDKRTMWSPSNKTPLFLLILPNLILLIVLIVFIKLIINLIKLSKS